MSEPFKLSRKTYFSLAVVILGTFMSSMASTIITPALPHIIADFGITASDAQWLTTIFLLVMGIMVPVTAYLIARFSTKLLFCASMLCFGIGTTFAAFAPSFTLVLTGRVIQSIGSGILVPLITTIMLWTFPKEKRGSAMGMIGLIIGVAPVIGPALSGWVTDMWGWRSMFTSIIPIAIIDIILAIFFLTNQDTPQQKVPLDLPSLILSTVGFFAILYAFGSVSTLGWTNPIIIGSIVVGFILVVLLFKRQLKLEHPFLDVRTLRSVPFLIGTIIAMLVYAALMFAGILIPIYLQNIAGFTATHTGFILMPGSIVIAALGPISGMILDKHGPRTMSIIGFILIIIGTLFYGICDENSSVILICTMFSLRSAGIALLMMPLTTWGMNSLENAVLAHATAINNTLRQAAGSIGSAMFISLYSMIAANSASMGVMESQLHAFHVTFLSSGLFPVIGLILCIIFVDRKKKKKLAQAEAAEKLPESADAPAIEAEKTTESETVSVSAEEKVN